MKKEMHENLKKWKWHIIGKMAEMEIKDFSDKELNRVFDKTVCKDRLIEYVKILEKDYAFTINDVYDYVKDFTNQYRKEQLNDYDNLRIARRGNAY